MNLKMFEFKAFFEFNGKLKYEYVLVFSKDKEAAEDYFNRVPNKLTCFGEPRVRYLAYEVEEIAETHIITDDYNAGADDYEKYKEVFEDSMDKKGEYARNVRFPVIISKRSQKRPR